MLASIIKAAFLASLCLTALAQSANRGAGRKVPKLGRERVVFQTKFGEFEVGFYNNIAPRTARHVLKLAQLGAYASNHFSIVEKNFYVQVERISVGRGGAMNGAMAKLNNVTLPLEASDSLKHEPGILTLGSDAGFGSSSFAILLAKAPHLDGKFTVFGKVTKGMGVVFELEDVMVRPLGKNRRPIETLHILSTYWYSTRSNVTTCRIPPPRV